MFFARQVNLAESSSDADRIFNVQPSFNRRYSVVFSLIGLLFLYHVIFGRGIPEAGQVRLWVPSLTVSGLSTLPGWSILGGTVQKQENLALSCTVMVFLIYRFITGSTLGQVCTTEKKYRCCAVHLQCYVWKSTRTDNVINESSRTGKILYIN